MLTKENLEERDAIYKIQRPKTMGTGNPIEIVEQMDRKYTELNNGCIEEQRICELMESNSFQRETIINLGRILTDLQKITEKTRAFKIRVGKMESHYIVYHDYDDFNTNEFNKKAAEYGSLEQELNELRIELNKINK